MADYTVTIDLPDHKRGDKWLGIPSIGPVVINGATPAAPLARVRMWLVHPTGEVFRLDSTTTTSPNAPITITDPTAWAAMVPAVQKFLQIAGDWTWDMEFYMTGETEPLTLYQGSLKVHSDITR